MNNSVSRGDLSPIGRPDNEFKGAVCEKVFLPKQNGFSTGSRKMNRTKQLQWGKSICSSCAEMFGSGQN